MPLEPVPWDRKDYFKERKRDRSESLGPVARWRESSTHRSSSREFKRWGSPEFRRPAGHGKQGGWHLFQEESGHGYASSRSYDKMVEEDNWRSTVSRGDRKYGRSYRESRGSFSRRDWREHPWQNNIGPLSFPRRHPGVNNDRRSVDDMLPYSSHPHSNFANTWQQRHFRDHHNKMGGVNGFGRGQRFDRENSLGVIDWKPLKWTRPGGSSSRGSGLSHSSRSRSIGATDSCERKAGLQQKNATAMESNSGEAAACETSTTYEETHSRKKPRLNWGEGLAKFEKKKVEGPDVSSNEDGPVTSLINIEPGNILHPSVVDKSAKVSIFSECESPATQSTVACNSSPGVDGKLFGKAAALENDVSNLRSSPGPGSQNHPQVFSFNLEKVDVDSLSGLGPSLFELVQSDDLSSADSSLLRSTTMNKLLILKADISKVLEVTEIEVDLLENELKSLKSEPGDKFPSSAAVDSLLLCYNSKSCDEHVGGSSNVARPESSEMVSSDDPNMEQTAHSTNLHCIHNNGIDDDINRHGAAMSKFVEPLPSINEVSSCNARRFGTCLGDLDVIQSTTVKCLVPCTYRQAASASACGDANSRSRFYPSTDDTLYNIISCNRETAKIACEAFAKLLPEDYGKINNIGASSESCSQDGAFIMEKIAEKKRFARFIERVLTLKFKALHHLWKKDVHVLSVRKCRPKSNKKPQLGLRTIRNAHQKKRSSIRLHFPLPGNPLNSVPMSELINYTSQLLSESQDIIHRSTLKMPALILDQKEKMISKFLSSNGLVEDPLAIEKERSMINPWTSEEREIFLEKFAAFGKDFRKIASFLDYKTTADCVEFYYKNHKSHYFEKIKKKDGGKLKKLFRAKNDLMASGKRCNREVNAASIEMLNAASVMADGIARNRKLRSGRSLWKGHGDMKKSRGKESVTARSSSFDILQDERETVAADVLAGICGSLSSEVMSSCMTSSVHPVEGNNDRKCVEVRSLCEQPLMPDVTQNIDDDTYSEESGGELDATDWTDGEKAVLLQAVSSFGKDFTMIAECVGTKSKDQCKVFFSKAQKSLGMNPPISENIGSLVNADANGGRSDSDDACNGEIGSVIGTDTSDIKAGEDLASSVMDGYHESNPVEARDVSADLIELKEINGEEVDVEDVNMVSNACVTKGKSILDSDGDEDVLYSSDKSGSVRGERAMIVSESIGNEKDKLNEMGGPELVSASEIIEPYQSNSVAEDRLVSEVSSGCHGNELVGLLTYLDRDNLHEAETDIRDELKNKVCDSGTTKNTSLSPIGISCPRFCSDSENQPQPCLDEKPHFSGSLEDPPTTAKSVLQDTAGNSLQCEKTASQNLLSSTSDFQGSRDISDHNSSSNGDCHIHNPGNLFDRIEAARRMLESYPLPVKDVNAGMSRSSSVTELPLLSINIEQADDHHETQLQCLSDSEKTSRSGDVKLFGKILTHHSSTRKLNLSGKGNEGKSATVQGLENISFTSYWNGNRVTSGFSILPDSSILRQSLPVLTGPSVNGSNGVIDYQMCRNKDGLKVQPSIVDVKHCEDVSSKMQRRNGFETVPNLLKQGEGVVVMNGVRRPGILVGGLSSGVSDPVAAIKMHYSNAAAQSGVQTGNIMSKDET